MQHIRSCFLLMIAVLLSVDHCHAADLLFISSDRHPSAAQRQIRQAAEFYGLNLESISGAALRDSSTLSKEIDERDLVGIVLEAEALPGIDALDFLHSIERRHAGRVPVLILGFRQELNPVLLKAWTGGHVTGCAPSAITQSANYEFGRLDNLTFQLWHVREPVSSSSAACSFTFDHEGYVQQIEWLRGDGGRHPIFIQSTVAGQVIFLASEAPQLSFPVAEDFVSTFLDIAPAMIFVRFCAGQRGWHAPQYYANLTIDDPWLREPYGFVDYTGLLREMQAHHFHTTIAFIPWNYDRSDPEVVSLFKNHPAEYSIAVHGDNHDHKEFTDYLSKPLALQVKAVAQSLARMDEFQRLTGIPYDKVMVFPHSIAPEQTLDALKSYNFLATVNSTNTPQGSVDRTTQVDRLRPVTLLYGGFPSIQRYSTGAPLSPTWIAVNEFLQNPLLFYTHSDFFAGGIGAFNHLADDVNNSEPSTEWRCLSDIVRHLYLIKTRPDGDYDVRLFSNEIRLENNAGQKMTFHLTKQEIGNQAVESVTVDGGTYPFSVSNGAMSLTLTVPAGKASVVSVKYVNRLQENAVGLSRDSFEVAFLRKASDFRDIYLAKVPLGLAFIHFYTERNSSPRELILYGAGILLMIAVVVFFLRRTFAHSVTERRPHQTTAK